jgi:proteasome lid subunit RPN8/RPN11
MVTRALLLVTISLITNVPAHAQRGLLTSDSDLFRDLSVQACFANLMREARSGFTSEESAAFVVMNADGALRCIDWPATHAFKEAHWKGPIPAGVVAMAHTHPLRSPYPSVDDRNEAVRIGMPIFVLSPQIISLVHRNGDEETLLCCKVWAAEMISSERPTTKHD